MLVELFFAGIPASELEGLTNRIVQELGSAWYAQAAKVLSNSDQPIDATSRRAVAPVTDRIQVRRIAVLLKTEAPPEEYWQVVIPVTLKTPELDESDILVARRIRPPNVAVEFTRIAASVTAARTGDFVDFVSLPFYGTHGRPAVGYVRKLEDNEKARVVVDANNRVEETDEKNNAAEVELGEPDAPKEDLFVCKDSVEVRRILIEPFDDDDHLYELVADQAVRVVRSLEVDAWVDVVPSRYPPPELKCGAAERCSLSQHHLVVRVMSHKADGAVDAVAVELAGLFAQQWYADDAAVLDDVVVDYKQVPEGNDPRFVAPETAHVGITLTEEADDRTYWRVEAEVVRTIPDSHNHWMVPRIHLPPRPVEVAFTCVEDEGLTHTNLQVVELPVDASRTVVALVEAGDDAERMAGKTVVDPNEHVQETDETNNVAEFAWERPAPQGTLSDLHFIPPRVRARRVACTASVDNPVLLDVAKNTALHALAVVDGFRAVHLHPWNSRVVGLSHLIEAPDAFEFDLVVVGVFSPELQATQGPAARLVEAYENEWYVQRAVAVEPKEALGELMPAPEDSLPWTLVVVLLKLTHTKQVQRYWRVAAPVVWEAEVLPLPPVDVNGPRKGWLDLFLPPEEEEEEGPGPLPPGFRAPHRRTPPPPTLVAVLFKAAFAADARGVLTRSAWDHVWLTPNEHGLAVGFVREAGAPLEGTAFVDPDDAIQESYENNNFCAYKLIPPNPLPGRFRAHVCLAPDPEDEDGEELLLVDAELSNPTDEAIELTFNSGLQLDYKIGQSYTWSADKVFPQVVTKVVVGPGSSMMWTLATPLEEIDWDGDETLIEVLLAGAPYRDVLPFPPPTLGDEPHEEEPEEEDIEDYDELEDVEEIIVGPDGVNLPLPPPPPGAPDKDQEIVKEPFGGNAELDGEELVYKPLNGFQGDDYLILDGKDEEGEDEDEDAPVLRRMKVGLQSFRLELDVGWNLASLPVQPVAGLQDLVARAPEGAVYAYRDGEYEEPDKVDVGEGFWFFTKKKTVLEYLGEPKEKTERVLAPGWNLVGTVNKPELRGLPGVEHMFGWNGKEYRPRGRAGNGEGCWIYVKERTAIPIN